MSFGMEILTTNGLESIANLRSFREVYRDTKTTTSGSQPIPGGATDSNTAVEFVINDGEFPPQVSWSGSTLSWSPLFQASNSSSDFEIVVFLFK
jgi:hypothetical protein